MLSLTDLLLLVLVVLLAAGLGALALWVVPRLRTTRAVAVATQDALNAAQQQQQTNFQYYQQQIDTIHARYRAVEEKLSEIWAYVLHVEAAIAADEDEAAKRRIQGRITRQRPQVDGTRKATGPLPLPPALAGTISAADQRALLDILTQAPGFAESRLAREQLLRGLDLTFRGSITRSDSAREDLAAIVEAAVLWRTPSGAPSTLAQVCANAQEVLRDTTPGRALAGLRARLGLLEGERKTA